MYGLQLRIKFLEKYVQSVTMQIESFEQVHLAPQRYIQLLAEAFRRRIFSTNYMKVILSMNGNFDCFLDLSVDSFFEVYIFLISCRSDVKKNFLKCFHMLRLRI